MAQHGGGSNQAAQALAHENRRAPVASPTAPAPSDPGPRIGTQLIVRKLVARDAFGL